MLAADTLRRADRLLGGAACAVLAWLAGRREARAWRRGAGVSDVLVLQLAEMGSMVLALPALADLQQRSPGVRLHFLVLRSSRALIDLLSLAPAARLYELDDRGLGRLLVSAWRAWRSCRRARLAATINFDFFAFAPAVFAFLACPRGERVGFVEQVGAPDTRARLLTRPVLYSTQKHTAVAFLALTRALLAAADSAPFLRERLEVSSLPAAKHVPAEAERSAVEALLGAGAGRPLLLVSPNASERLALRRWPVERFAGAIRRWLELHPEWQAAVVGTDADRAAAAALVAEAPGGRCLDLAGRTTFPQLLALMDRAQLLLCNDSGPAHFASLVGLPAVVLFGPETPALYAPLGGQAECLWADFACSPCVTAANHKFSACPRALCLEAISVDEVLAAMERASSRRAP
jgi:ADP-heptose:LPS heptosyltransferase